VTRVTRAILTADVHILLVEGADALQVEALARQANGLAARSRPPVTAFVPN
jgi:hypothetical protein